MTYRKRRILPAPNKNAAKVQRREVGTGPDVRIGSLNPLLENALVQLEFYDGRGNLLEQRQHSYGPEDEIALQVDCLGPCGHGKMDLEEKFRSMIGSHQTMFDGRAKCTQTLYAGAADVCGYELRCHTKVAYKNT